MVGTPRERGRTGWKKRGTGREREGNSWGTPASYKNPFSFISATTLRPQNTEWLLLTEAFFRVLLLNSSSSLFTHARLGPIGRLPKIQVGPIHRGQSFCQIKRINNQPCISQVCDDNKKSLYQVT